MIASHVLAEVAQTADDVVILAAGRLRFAGPLGELGRGECALESAFLKLTQAPAAGPGPAARAT